MLYFCERLDVFWVFFWYVVLYCPFSVVKCANSPPTLRSKALNRELLPSWFPPPKPRQAVILASKTKWFLMKVCVCVCLFFFGAVILRLISTHLHHITSCTEQDMLIPALIHCWRMIKPFALHGGSWIVVSVAGIVTQEKNHCGGIWEMYSTQLTWQDVQVRRSAVSFVI